MSFPADIFSLKEARRNFSDDMRKLDLLLVWADSALHRLKRWGNKPEAVRLRSKVEKYRRETKYSKRKLRSVGDLVPAVVQRVLTDATEEKEKLQKEIDKLFGRYSSAEFYPVTSVVADFEGSKSRVAFSPLRKLKEWRKRRQQRKILDKRSKLKAMRPFLLDLRRLEARIVPLVEGRQEKAIMQVILPLVNKHWDLLLRMNVDKTYFTKPRYVAKMLAQIILLDYPKKGAKLFDEIALMLAQGADLAKLGEDTL